MASILNGVFCGIPGGYGLNFTCTGPACNLVGNLSTLTCTTKDSTLSCANGKNCTGTNFTDVFTLRVDDGRLSATDLFDVNGQQSTLVSNYTSNGNVTSNSTTPSTSSSGSLNSTSSSSPSRTATKSSAHRTSTRSLVYTTLGLWLLAFILLPGVAATLSPATFSNNTSRDLIILEPRANGVRESFELTANAKFIVTAGSDVLLANAKAEGKQYDPAVLGMTLFDGLRNSLLPTETNIQIDIIEGKPEDAAKDAIKAVAEPLLDAALEGVAPETLGASLLLLFVTHVAVDIAVDELFRGAHVLTEFLANATQGHGGTGGKACDSSNYPSSPWFFRSNEFGTDDWRDCKSCCVDWGKALYPATGDCGCCLLAVQKADPSLNCCSNEYFNLCCSVDCPA